MQTPNLVGISAHVSGSDAYWFFLFMCFCVVYSLYREWKLETKNGQ
jgi:hypothetical protein